MVDDVRPVHTLSDRVASYVDPLTRAKEDATYIRAGGAELFCVLHRASATPRCGIVVCPSLYAEELKIYGTQVLAARAFAAAGFAVMRFHYRGTGHSGGVMDDSTVDTMLEDVSTAIAHLNEQVGVRSLAFCGGRWGAFIAGLAAREHPGAPLILWEPVVDGHGYFRDIFRASQLSALAGGASALTVTQAVEQLRATGCVDTLGYPIHRGLYDSAERRSLMPVTADGARPVLLVQVSRHRELKPEFSRLRDAFAVGGSSVETALVEGEGAWAFVDSPMPSPGAIVEASLSWLERTVPGNPS